MRSSHAYRPDIDGLRAIAIFAVLIYHLDNHLSKGGFIGVDVFFVISGFLITTIILADMAAGRFSLAGFYERRVRRILPALFACLAATTIAGYFLLFPAEFVLLAKSVIAATFFVANFFYAGTSGYFMPAARTLPLIHTWSLAVEEQFYMLFPLALLLFVRARREVLVMAVVLAAFTSLVCSEILVQNQSKIAYYQLAPRGWELLIGSLLAIGAVPEVKTQRTREILSILGLLAIVIPTFAFSKNTPFPGLWALVPCLGAAALIHTGRERDTFAARLLSTRPFVGLGLISYSLYLWHLPIITYYHLQFELYPTWTVKILLGAVSVAIACLSWRFIEQPFRTKRVAPQRRQVFAFGLAAAGSVAAIAVVVIQGQGWKERYPPEIRQLAAFRYDPSGPMREGTCFISRAAARVTEFEQDRCLALSRNKKNVLVVGDSYAAHLWSGLSKTFPDVNFLQATASGCPQDLTNKGSDRCRDVMKILFEQFLPGKRLDAIIVAMNWSGRETPTVMKGIERLRPHARALYVFGPLVKYTSPLPRLLTRSKLYHDPGLINEARVARNFKTDIAFRKFFKGKGVHYISLIDALCHNNACTTIDENGFPLQFDNGHLTAPGSALLARRLTDRLAFSN